MSQDVCGACHHAESLPPSSVRVCGAEPRAYSEGDTVVRRRGVEAENGLGHDESDVVLHPVFEPRRPSADRIKLGRTRIDPDFAVDDRHRECPDIVGKRIERTAAREVEPRVVPVARQDAVSNGASVQREAHVRAAVVDRSERVPMAEHGDRMTPARDHRAPTSPDRLHGPHPQQTAIRRRHSVLSGRVVTLPSRASPCDVEVLEPAAGG